MKRLFFINELFYNHFGIDFKAKAELALTNSGVWGFLVPKSWEWILAASEIWANSLQCLTSGNWNSRKTCMDCSIHGHIVYMYSTNQRDITHSKHYIVDICSMCCFIYILLQDMGVLGKSKTNLLQVFCYIVSNPKYLTATFRESGLGISFVSTYLYR